MLATLNWVIFVYYWNMEEANVAQFVLIVMQMSIFE